MIHAAAYLTVAFIGLVLLSVHWFRIGGSYQRLTGYVEDRRKRLNDK